MKVLIDTNVILDVLCKREEFLEDSLKVWKYCEVDQITGYVSALSIPNIVYILRKELDPEKTKEIIDKLFLIFRIADLKSDDLKKAANMKVADYEDAVQMACASRLKADFIITRNIRDFKESRVPAIKPSELLERI
ncbi:MAG: PIN domain-containing protein [Ruminococcus sp.]|nr:PIN domain-containing protein [Ruminococcus sp.]